MNAEKSSQIASKSEKIKANEFDIVPINKLIIIVSSVVIVTLGSTFAMWQFLATAESKLYFQKVVEKKTPILISSDGKSVDVKTYIKKQKELLVKGGNIPETKERVLPIEQAIDKLVKNPSLIEKIE